MSRQIPVRKNLNLNKWIIVTARRERATRPHGQPIQVRAVNRRAVCHHRPAAGLRAIPFFPSDPPRTLFAGSDLPSVLTPLRKFNLWIVNGYGIHSSVFPSAHVSSAFSAAWALLLNLPRRKRIGIGMLIYADSVAIATVYGRYHYAVDAVAGLGVSLLAAGMVLAANKRE